MPLDCRPTWASAAWHACAWGDSRSRAPPPPPRSTSALLSPTPTRADIINGAQPPLPAYPVRAACQQLADGGLAGDPLRLLRQLAAAVGVFYNHTGDLACLSFRQGPNPETGGWVNGWVGGLMGGGRAVGRRWRQREAGAGEGGAGEQASMQTPSAIAACQTRMLTTGGTSIARSSSCLSQRTASTTCEERGKGGWEVGGTPLPGCGAALQACAGHLHGCVCRQATVALGLTVPALQLRAPIWDAALPLEPAAFRLPPQVLERAVLHPAG